MDPEDLDGSRPGSFTSLLSQSAVSPLLHDGHPRDAEANPACHALPSHHAVGGVGATVDRESLCLLTVTAMLSEELANILAALGCTSTQLRRRGLELWQTQVVTMDTSLRQVATGELELRLVDANISQCVSIFREVLQGHERDLFNRFLYVMATVERSDANDTECVGAALQCLESERRSRGNKRKRGQLMTQSDALVRDFGMEASPDDAGAKRAKTGARSLERLLLLLGLAGVTTTKVLECGVALYCEAHRRPSAFAQKYAARHISACLPQATLGSLLRFFYYLLGDSLFALLCDDLQTQTQVVSRHRSGAITQPEEGEGLQVLITAYQAVLERVARNHTAFERRQRVRQLTEAVMNADTSLLAQTFYEHLDPCELEAWGQQLHVLERDDLWRPL